MQGCVQKRGSIYYIRADLGRDSKGKRIQKYKGGFKKKREAQEYLANLLLEVKKGDYLEPSQEAFNDYLLRWFHSSFKRSVAETTADSRWCIVNKHFLPYFKGVSLDKITPLMLDEFYNDKLDLGLATKTVREMHNLLNRAFLQAIKWSLIKNNPVSDATPPKVITKEVNPWNQKQTELFLKVVEEAREEMFYVVAIFTGMRRGEILGLKWDDIDLLQGKIHVSRSLARVKGKGLLLKDVKTKKSKRQISISPYVIGKLKVHLERQQSWISLTKGIYKDQGMVFSASNGNFKDPDNQLREFNRCIKQAGVPKITIHDLRHLHATLMLKNGENPKVVSERLGHSRVGITLDIYTHVTADIQDEAALRLEQSFFPEVADQTL